MISPTSSAAELQDSFLELMTTQLTHQDPFEPMKNEDFLGQMAQISSLNSLTDMNAKFDDMLQLEELSAGNALIGRTVTWQPADLSETRTGSIENVAVRDGRVTLQVNGESVTIDQVRTVVE